MDRLKDKVAVITGGNSGVGAATAKLFAAEGATVVITARREAALQDVAREIEEKGGKVLAVATDISKPEDPEKLMEKAIDMRHPKARRVLEKWNAEGAKVDEETDLADIKHRLNDEDYKKDREQIRRHLRRARQYLAVKDMKKALEECEVVLVNDPYNEDAIRVRAINSNCVHANNRTG